MSVADDLVAAFEPWLTPDLESYLRTIGGMFSQVEMFVEDTDELEGWSILLDPDLCPAWALPYLAQYVGERLPVGIDEAMAREWIKDAPNQRRGTVSSIVRTAQRTLTDPRHVVIVERDGVGGADDPGRVTVMTYISETPNGEVVRADLERDVIPFDIELNYQTVPGQPWSSITGMSWREVMNTYPSWSDVAEAQTGFTTYSRPRP